jgi:hypothetical protein
MSSDLEMAFLREPSTLRPHLNCYTVSVSTNLLRTRKVTVLARTPAEAAVMAPDFLTYLNGEKPCRVNPNLEVTLVPRS